MSKMKRISRNGADLGGLLIAVVYFELDVVNQETDCCWKVFAITEMCLNSTDYFPLRCSMWWPMAALHDEMLNLYLDTFDSLTSKIEGTDFPSSGSRGVCVGWEEVGLTQYKEGISKN
jgi:hypothetical protein